VVDIRAQRMQRHPAFTVPLRPGDLGTAEPTGAIDADALGTQPHRGLHGTLHRPTEGNPALKLLRNVLGDQQRVDLRLPHFLDVEEHLGFRHLRNLAPELLDIGSLLADDNTRPGGMDGHPALLVRPLDDDLGNARLLELPSQEIPDGDVLVQKVAVLMTVCVPPRIPGAVNAEAQPDRIDFLPHQAASSTCRTTMVRRLNGLTMRPTRPRALALHRLISSDLPT